ncbi:MAG: UDP-3-O-acyl-N-acetylglucosamine deacetylase, partial [Thermoanaerobaculia bacterium]
ILDLIGDLALIGRPIAGEITAYRAGHALHSRFVEKILRVAVTEESMTREVVRRPYAQFA